MPPQTLLYGEYDNSGDLIREYVYLNGAPLAQINAGSPETLTYLHPDHLGTPKFGTNAGGTQVWAWAPDAFGNGAPTGSATVNLRMPGQYFDAESGLFYNWNRYYNPAIGRYISSDPIGLEGGINTFLYAAANPVMAVDPEGLNPLLVCAANPGCATVATEAAVITGEALAAAAAATVGGLATSVLMGDSATTTAGASCQVGNNDPCSELYREIDRAINELKKRYSDLLEDRLKLPLFGKFSIRGHQQQYEQWQSRLRALLTEANINGRTAYNPEAWKWAWRPTPSPLTTK